MELIQQLHEKYRAHADHATHVAALAGQLFTELAAVHGLGDEEVRPLIAAAYLHDLGYFIHQKKHHKHSAHIILHDHLLDGWEASFRDQVALLALNHRKKVSLPGDLGRRERERLTSLIALLRLADVLDYEHEQRTVIERVEIDQANGRIALQLSGMPLHAHEEQIRKKGRLAVETWKMSLFLTSDTEELMLES